MNKDTSLILPDPDILIEMNKGFAPCSTRSWARDVKKLYGYKCVISGAHQSETKLVAHHLNSRKQYSQYQYSLLNGIPLSEFQHKELHKNCGQHTTIPQFLKYLDYLCLKEPCLYSKNRLLELKQWILFLEQNLN